MLREIIRLALPITLGQLGMVLMGFTDILMLGRYDTVSMSSAGVGNAVFFLFSLIGMGTLFAISTIVAIADGEGKPEQAIPVFLSSFKVSAGLSLVLMNVNHMLVMHFEIFRQTEDLTSFGSEYLRIVNYSVPALLFFNNGKMLMDGLGFTKVSMVVTLIGLLLNIPLNYILIFGKMGFSDMGLEGAAWASVISRTVMAILMLAAAWYHPKIKALKKVPHEKKPYALSILRIGLPVGFTFFFEIAAFSFALIMAGMISGFHSGAHQIAINLASVTYMFVTGISAAGSILVGNFYGAADLAGVRRSGLATIGLTLLIELFFSIIFLVFSNELPRWYTDDPILLQMTPPLIILAAFFQMSDGLQASAAGVLRGIKDTKATGIIAFVSYWVLMMPGAYYLCFEAGLGLRGIWMAFVAGLSLAAILLLYRFFHLTGKGKLKFGDET